MGVFEDRAVRYITDLIRDFQLEDYQAAGFPGNFGEETGGFVHVQEISPLGGGQGGLGDAQWTGSRRRDFEAWIARNASKGWDARTYEANYSMLFRDLDGPESGALTAVRRASDADEAAEIVMERYERPAAATAHLDVRQDYARKALAAFRASGINVAQLKATGRAPARDGEILPPAVVMPDQHQPDVLGKLLPAILQAVLPTVVQTVTKAQPDVGNIITQVMEGVKAQTPPPPTTTTTPATPASQRPSVWLSTAAAVGAALLQAHGDLGTPAGPNATTTGLMTNVLTVGSAIFGAVGGWQGIGRMALGLLKLVPK